jgi:hypothetical protein
MHSFTYRGFGIGPPPDRKPVWILLTALAFAIIGLMTVFGTTRSLTPGTDPLNVNLATPAPSSMRQHYF